VEYFERINKVKILRQRGNTVIIIVAFYFFILVSFRNQSTTQSFERNKGMYKNNTTFDGIDWLIELQNLTTITLAVYLLFVFYKRMRIPSIYLSDAHTVYLSIG